MLIIDQHVKTMRVKIWGWRCIKGLIKRKIWLNILNSNLRWILHPSKIKISYGKICTMGMILKYNYRKMIKIKCK